MNVKELREALAGLDDDMKVVLQIDAEGNGYKRVNGADADGIIVNEDQYSFDVYSDSWDATEADMDEDEWAELLTQPRVLVVHPL